MDLSDEIMIKTMENEQHYDNDELDPPEKYFERRKKVMIIPSSLQKNQNQQIIKNIRKFIDRFFKIKKVKIQI